MISSCGYTSTKIMEITLVASIPLIILGTVVAMIAKINREEKENSIIWDWIEIAIEIISGMDILCLIVLSYYSPNLFINFSLSLMNHIFGE